MAADIAALKIRSGERDIVIVGGMESFSRVPYMVMEARWGIRSGVANFEDANLWAYNSIRKWMQAQERGFFKEVFPVEVPQRKGH